MSVSVKSKTFYVAARTSPLSRKQVEEVQREISQYYPEVILEPYFIESYGDKDLVTSLRTAASDFFTKEIDEAVLSGRCSLAVHSAKDLPDELSEGLEIIALTQGVDPKDVLVFREGQSLKDLKEGSIIGVSCTRREEAILNLNASWVCKDIRGTIDRRLSLLNEGQYDAVVIAEAALIRLGLTHLNRMDLAIKVHPYQGKLAIVARKNDQAMKELFASLDTRALCQSCSI